MGTLSNNQTFNFSNHHHMIYTSCFQNKEPKVLNYRDFMNFSSEDFKKDLPATLNECGDSYDVFEQRFVANLNKHAPNKKKLIRGNNQTHMKKILLQAIMKKSILKHLKIMQVRLKIISTSEITKNNETW